MPPSNEGSFARSEEILDAANGSVALLAVVPTGQQQSKDNANDHTHTHARDAPIVLDLNERQHGTASWRRGSCSLRHCCVRWRFAPFPQCAATLPASKCNGTNAIQKTTNCSDCRSSVHTVKEPTTTPNNVNQESLQPLTRTAQSSNTDDDNNSQPERTITPATTNNVQAGISSAHKTATTIAIRPSSTTTSTLGNKQQQYQ